MNQIALFKEKLKKSHTLGMFMKSTDPSFVEVAGFSGFDFVILDLEHGYSSYETLTNLVRASIVSNTIPIVRISEISEDYIKKVLDLGAYGLQVPKVTSKKDVEKIIELSKFYPLGERGLCRFVRGSNFTQLNKNEYITQANQNLIIIQLEGKKAVENIDEILEVGNVDVIFIGPYDLSQSLGVPGDIFNEKVISEMKKIIQKCQEKDIIVGTFVDNEKGFKMWREVGVQYLAYSVDVGLFAEKCREITLKYKNDTN